VNTNVRLAVAYHHQPVYQAPTITADDGPRPVAWTYTAYCQASMPVPTSRPIAEKTQPIALPGRLVTITAPTTMNPANASSSAAWPTTSPSKKPLITPSHTAGTMHTTKTTTMIRATQVERCIMVPARLLRRVRAGKMRNRRPS